MNTLNLSDPAFLSIIILNQGTPYRYYKLLLHKLRVAGNAWQLSEWNLYNASGNRLTGESASLNTNNVNGYGANNANDGLVSTSMLTTNILTPSETANWFTSLTYDFITPRTISYYNWITSTDITSRDMIRWSVHGSNDNINWTWIDERCDSDQSVTTSRNATIGNFFPTSVVQIEVDLNYVSNNDNNGLFYYLGSNKKTQTFTNPYSLSEITFVATVEASAFPNFLILTDRSLDDQRIYTYATQNEYIGVDIGFGRTIKINNYSLRSTPYNIPRRWKLQGSNNVLSNTVTGFNNATWVDIDTRNPDNSLAGNTTVTFSPNGSTTDSFRWIRILSIGANSEGSTVMELNQWEFYGRLAYHKNI